jgi:hypothetical protein
VLKEVPIAGGKLIANVEARYNQRLVVELPEKDALLVVEGIDANPHSR